LDIFLVRFVCHGGIIGEIPPLHQTKSNLRGDTTRNLSQIGCNELFMGNADIANYLNLVLYLAALW